MWSLEEIEVQASRGGVNRQQAEQLVGEVRQLRQAIEQIADGNSPHDAQLVACFVAETWRANAQESSDG
jgi:hypothetical protein